MQRKRQLRAAGLTVVFLILLSCLEEGFVSESPAVSEAARKLLYLVFLAVVCITGWVFWRRRQPEWICRVWLIAYTVVVAILIAVNLLARSSDILSVTFLDQVRYFRIFFTSPFPFLVSLLLSEMDRRNNEAETDVRS